MQATLWTLAAASAGIASSAAIAERRRARRVGLDRIGWVPWPQIMLAALLVGAVCAALALKS